MSLRAIKEKARSQVHAALSYPAKYFIAGAVEASFSCTVRVHDNFEPIYAGDMDSEGFARRVEQDTVLRFYWPELNSNDDVPAGFNLGRLDKIHVFTKESDHAYYDVYVIDHVLDPYGDTQDAKVRAK